MESADLAKLDDFSHLRRMYITRLRSILLQRQVRPGFVMIGKIGAVNSLQMHFA